MDFLDLVKKVQDITGLDSYSTVRLLTANLAFVTRSLVDAMSDEVDPDLAERMIEIARLAAADTLELRFA